MSLTSFPDIIGPSAVAANAGTSVVVPRGRLNVVSTGVTATDNPGRRRTDLNFPDPAFVAVSSSRATPGEWQPAIAGTANADLIRVTSLVSGVILTGADFTDPQIKLVKFFANSGANTITMQPPTSPIAGHAYFANSFTLRANETARAVWDVVSLVYRINSAVAAPLVDRIVVGGVFITLDGNHIHKP